MKHLRKYENYYDPPPDVYDDPLYEGVMDRLWSKLINDGYSQNLVELYLDELDKHINQITNFIYNIVEKLIDEQGKYPWSREIENEYTSKKYGTDYFKLRTRAIEIKLQEFLLEKLYNNLDKFITIQDFEVQYNVDKFNL